jgi:nucleoside-diphosphate-sugar epimerase
MYGASKKAMEQLAFTYYHNHGVQVTCLRIFNAYGERMREDLVLPKWVQSITRGESIKLSGAGTRIRDFTYVKDVARAFLLASRIPGFHVVNVGSAKPVSLKKLLGVVEKVLGKKAEIVPYASHHGSVEMTHADTKLAKKLLMFTTAMPLEEGVRAYVSWLTGKR